MLRIMKKKNPSIWQNKLYMFSVVSVMVATALGGSVGYGLAYGKYNPGNLPVQNTPGYITSDEARNQVNNFYQQYLHPKKETPEASRETYIQNWGSSNLVFYSRYYRHGFDPIVCSSVMPTSVIATDVQSGAGAEVKAKATYPDGSTADIALTLVLNLEGFRIDTITCPGDKGNLPPADR